MVKGIKARGFTLLHVLVLLAILSAVLLSETRFLGVKQSYSALVLTVAQTQMLLNDAYSYHLKNGDWNHSGTSCLLSHPNVINGFGQGVYCEFPDVSSTSLGARIAVVQWVPSYMASLLKDKFGDDADSYTGSAPSGLPAGYSGVVVYTDAAGGAVKTVDTFLLESAASTNIRSLQCASGNASEKFVALDGECSHVYRRRTLYWKSLGPCDSRDYPSDDLVYAGFDYNIGMTGGGLYLSSQYNAYRLDYWLDDGSYDDHHFGLPCPTSGNYHYRDYTPTEDEDGMSNADVECNGKKIEAMIFQVCE